jgi:hypothetical protein
LGAQGRGQKEGKSGEGEDLAGAVDQGHSGGVGWS